MSRPSTEKNARYESLKKMIQENTFMTDEELAEHFAVSVPTIRLDRGVLKIPELRKRVKDLAETNVKKVKSIIAVDIPGELIALDLNQSGTLSFETNAKMAFTHSNVVKGQYVYSMAESLAIAVIDAEVALVGVANIKYVHPVMSGDRLVAQAQVKRIKGNSYIVWVLVYANKKEVFRGKFILVSIETKE
ncbi:MAG: transcription factor FapR [Clostridia bacterium]